jgi:hypothetical protein
MNGLFRNALLASFLVGLVGCTIQTYPPPQQPTTSATTPAPAPAPTPAPAPAPTASATPAPGPAPSGNAQAFEETKPPSDKPEDIKFNIADGRPKGMKANAPQSFWLWNDAKGTRWHVRATTHAVLHRYHGAVLVDKGGKLSDVKPTKMEMGDRVRSTPTTVSFDFQTQAESDGFDFESHGSCVRFYLMVDGKPAKDMIQIGASNARPTTANFRLCP